MFNPLKSLTSKKKATSSWIRLWDSYLTNLHHKNDSGSQTHPVRNHNFYSDFTGTYSGVRRTSVYFSIDGFDTEMNLDYRTQLRWLCHQGVRINFIDNNEPYRIDWNNKETKNRFRIWSSIDKNINNGDIDAYNYAENLSSLDQSEVRQASLTYIANAVLKRKREMFKIQTLMIVSGERGRDFDTSLMRIEEQMSKMGIKNTRITGNISDYLKVFSPFSVTKNQSIANTVGTNILPDEIISRNHTYGQGKVGVGTLYWGSDIENQFPVLSEPKRNSTDAEIWLIIAETGGGKSYEVKGLLPQLLARRDMVGTINDIENEYVYLAYLLNSDDPNSAKILDFGSDQGNYFDATEIHLTGNEELDITMYEDSYNLTVEVFKALGISQKALDKGETETEWAVQLIKDGVTQAYRQVGVLSNDMTTWKNSKGLRYRAVYEQIKRLDRDNEDFKRAKDLLVAKLDSYFDKYGAHSTKFHEDKRITLDQIIGSKLVINKFGLSGRSGDDIDETQMALMQLYTTQIGHIRAVFAKSRGMFNFKVFEEVQRWAKMSGSASILNATITGERKLGTITIVISNKVSELLDNDSLGVFQNYTTVAIGAIADAKVRKRLTDTISMPLMLPELDEIAKQSKVTGEEFEESRMTSDEIENNPYAKAFMVYINRSEYAVCKMRLPKDISNSRLFKTGVDTKLNKNKKDTSISEIY